MLLRLQYLTKYLPDYDPTKQGLKPLLNYDHKTCNILPDYDPTKQGLKPKLDPKSLSAEILPDYDPTKQGLKPKPLYINQRERKNYQTTIQQNKD